MNGQKLSRVPNVQIFLPGMLIRDSIVAEKMKACPAVDPGNWNWVVVQESTKTSNLLEHKSTNFCRITSPPSTYASGFKLIQALNGAPGTAPELG